MQVLFWTWESRYWQYGHGWAVCYTGCPNILLRSYHTSPVFFHDWFYLRGLEYKDALHKFLEKLTLPRNSNKIAFIVVRMSLVCVPYIQNFHVIVFGAVYFDSVMMRCYLLSLLLQSVFKKIFTHVNANNQRSIQEMVCRLWLSRWVVLAKSVI